MSKEHIEYLKNIKRRKWLTISFQILIMVLIVLFWQIAADKKWINTFISSSPKMVFNTIFKLYKDGDLFHHIWVTLYEVLISFGLGSLVGLLLATLLWRYDFLYRVIDPYLTVLNSMPKVSLGPIIIIIAGASAKSIILMALFISLIITVIDVHHAFKYTDSSKIRLLKSFGASQKQIYFKLIFPGNVGNLINISKVGLSLIFVGVITGEFLVSKAGVGYLIMYGSQIFNLNLVMSGIIILCVMASLMYYIIVIIQKLLNRPN